MQARASAGIGPEDSAHNLALDLGTLRRMNSDDEDPFHAAPRAPTAAPPAADGRPRRRASSSFSKADRDELRASAYGVGAARSQCGYLLKQTSGAVKRWQRRFFFMQGHYLNYMETQESTGVKGALDTREIVRASLRSNKILLDLGDTMVKLKADTEPVARNWVAAIQQVIGGAASPLLHHVGAGASALKV